MIALSLLLAIDLGGAAVVSPPNLTGPEKKAVAMLIEEVEKRTGIRWQAASQWPANAPAVIAVAPASALGAFAGRFTSAPAAASGGEGYRLWTEAGNKVFVAGNDARGVLFGVGRLLRSLRMTKGAVTLPGELRIATAPKARLRGHQLGYRPKTNSYDGWTVATWEQYIRDLAVFGTNAIELIPPRSDDAGDSPHFPLPPMRMMIEMSRLADEYGIDLWIWYPAMDRDYSDPKTVESAWKEWSDVFRQLPRVDAVFVPGGDPGHTQPKVLMALLEKQTQGLRRYHPKAQMWVSPQSFSQAWLEEFLGILRNEQPAWLAGIAAGPQIRISLARLRAEVPKRYPIRDYPDITHSRHCQYPVPDWDTAFAITEGREAINPRPMGEARICRLMRPHTDGFIAYSEGCNDDVNKIVWSSVGWDPDADVAGVLREYSRYFIGEVYADAFAQGLLALERNWQGPLLTNGHVYTTLEQFRAMERSATPRELANWRFQQALYRAYYDAYIRGRLIFETGLEEQAMEKLGEARRGGSLAAMEEAERILGRARTQDAAAGWRARVFELAEALFQSVRMQLSVARYKAIAVERGANLDSIDTPLNNAPWLRQRFAEIRKLEAEAERLRALEEIVEWTNPGPGGFYDDLGDLARQPHLVRGAGFQEDPAFLQSSLVGFRVPLPTVALRSSWLNHAEALNDAPLMMHYPNLDREASYKVRVVYGGDAVKRKIRLLAGDSIEVHPLIDKPFPFRPLEFDIPPAATAGGELRLSWSVEAGLGGNGRGCQVAEVWLIRK